MFYGSLDIGRYELHFEIHVEIEWSNNIINNNNNNNTISAQQQQQHK